MMEWVIRLKEEQRVSLNTWFITLTYNDKHIPIGADEDGIPTGWTLRKEDLQKFLKKLRHWNSKIYLRFRYFAVGEYGGRFGRPHYHILMFNMSPQLVSRIEEIWGKGRIDCQPVSQGAIEYCATYHVTVDKKKRLAMGVCPEFTTQSGGGRGNRGIGYSYVERAGNWHRENEKLYIPVGNFKFRLPDYYRKIIWKDNEEELRRIISEGKEHGEEEEMKEIARLEKEGVKNPYREILSRNIIQANLLGKRIRAKKRHLD